MSSGLSAVHFQIQPNQLRNPIPLANNATRLPSGQTAISPYHSHIQLTAWTGWKGGDYFKVL